MSVSPPVARNLPINAMRAFESAARLGGFTSAASELGVTASAVTAHVKTLEAHLGTLLFERTAQGVVLTTAGARALPALTAAFDALATASHALRAEAVPRIINVATLPAIAQLWLAPRLQALRVALPDISVSISAMEVPPNLKRTPYDLCLFYGETGKLIAEDMIFPVCTPAVAAQLVGPQDLANVDCLTDMSWMGDWKTWLVHAAPGRVIQPKGPRFSLYALALDQAVKGAGVLMGHSTLVAPYLASGQLVAPYTMQVHALAQLRGWAMKGVAERVLRVLMQL